MGNKNIKRLSALAIFIVAGANAFAGITPTLMSDSSANVSLQIPQSDISSPISITNTLLSDSLNSQIPNNSINTPLPSDESSLTTQLPSDKDSIYLFFYAAGSLGLWQIGRSTKKIHAFAGNIPDWYHSGGARQIGGALALEWDAPKLPQIILLWNCTSIDDNDQAIPSYVDIKPKCFLTEQIIISNRGPRSPPADSENSISYLL
jgi:hypothetical protein